MTKKTEPPINNDSSTWKSAKEKLGDAIEQWNQLADEVQDVDAPDEKERQKRHKLLKELESKIRELSK